MKNSEELKQAITRLRSEKAALQVQSRLLDNFVNFARSSAKERVLTRLLQKTLEISAELTAADKGSLFLLDAAGAVTDGILTRVDPTPEQRSRIIGQVFDKGRFHEVPDRVDVELYGFAEHAGVIDGGKPRSFDSCGFHTRARLSRRTAVL